MICGRKKIDELASQAMRTGKIDSKSSWGNVEEFKKLMESEVSGFIDAKNKSVMVLNPEKYIVRRAATDFKITELKDVSLVEKVQIISEIVLKKCMDLGQIDKARCCVVYEEAHSLTPEFNSVVVKDDNSHANGTAKVICKVEVWTWLHYSHAAYGKCNKEYIEPMQYNFCIKSI